MTQDELDSHYCKRLNELRAITKAEVRSEGPEGVMCEVWLDDGPVMMLIPPPKEYSR